MLSIKKNSKFYKAYVKIDNSKRYFVIPNNFKSNIYNILAALAVISLYTNIFRLKLNTFLKFKTPSGRGDFLRLNINKKIINLIDESYNSNPLSLKSAILNYDKLDKKNSKKYLLLGDMLELGKYSKHLHQLIAPIINRTKIDKIFVKGRNVVSIFNKLSKSKKGKILTNNSQIIELIKSDLNNNDYLMVKASNATGFNRIIKNLRGSN